MLLHWKGSLGRSLWTGRPDRLPGQDREYGRPGHNFKDRTEGTGERGTRAVEQNSRDRTARENCWDRTARKGNRAQDGQNMTARTGQLGQGNGDGDKRGRTVRIWHLGQDHQESGTG